jgi:hypothetical protein
MIATTLLLLIILLALSVPVAAVMGVLGLALNQFYASMPLHRAMGEIVWNSSSEYILIAIPLFVMPRSCCARESPSASTTARPGSWLPGGLMHSNIAACAMFAATSGSSVATAATIGTVAMGEIKKHGYSERLFLGTIAAGGTLGILIPPSINSSCTGCCQPSVPRLYRRASCGLYARWFLHGDRAFACLIDRKRAARPSNDLGQPNPRAAELDPTPVHSSWWSADLCRCRRRQNASLGVVLPSSLLPGSDRMLRRCCARLPRHDAHDRDDHAHHGAVPQLRAGRHRSDDGLGKIIEGLGLGKYGTMV